MQLRPRYDDPTFLRLEVPAGDPAVPMLRQRRRLADLLRTFDDAQWAAPTRCDGWSVQDVAAHLVSVNQFWALSITAGRAGEPSRFLATFDPVATPAELVAGVRSMPWAKVLDKLVETNEALADAIDGLDEAGWSTTTAEAPPGHVALRALALHALWDAWIHERDVVVPLGLPPVEEADEIEGSLAYGAALSPAFSVATGSTRSGAIAVDAADPDVRFVVDVGDDVLVRGGDAPDGALRLTGSAVELVEALALRAPLPCPVPDEHAWLVRGLAEAFDQA